MIINAQGGGADLVLSVAQTLTDTQKQQVRTNIEALSSENSAVATNNIAVGAISATANGTLPKDSWTGSAEPYTQTVTVAMLKTYTNYSPRLSLNTSDTYETAVAEKEAWCFIVDADVNSTTGAITFRASSKPEVDLNFICEVNKR